MQDNHYDEISQVYLLLCGAAFLLEGYGSKVLPNLRRLPDRTACHIMNGVMNAVLEARHMLQRVLAENEAAISQSSGG